VSVFTGIGEMLVAAIFLGVFALTTLMTVVFVSRQLFMTLFILFTNRRSAYTELELSQWPTVTVVIPAHNEELVIDGGLRAMSKIDYPHDRITFLVLNDRSTDRTRELASAWEARDRRFKVYNRAFDAEPGKPAAIKEVISQLESEIMVFFDADYLPEPAIIKHLVAPYIDPEVGSTMGRVVPYNTNANMLTKLIDLERRGGYVVDQQARSLLNFLPQFGGTCGSVRLAALNEAGGWRKDVLAEDTDLTYRLFLHGWTVEYLNHAACYEESPEHWPTRMKQVRRWAYGHNECMFRYFFKVLGCKQPLVRRLDASACPVVLHVPGAVADLSGDVAVLSAVLQLSAVQLFSRTGDFLHDRIWQLLSLLPDHGGCAQGSASRGPSSRCRSSSCRRRFR
jgi:cellulose synthase/poly-beta-1,6-N-acetylglucosamine synthase-like glycosyltransferase